MAAVARVGDPISHGGSITSGSPTTLSDGAAVARVTDTASCTIHGVVTITSGSPTIVIDGRALARVGSTLSCGAVITAGSPAFFCD